MGNKGDLETMIKHTETEEPKILTLDIETSPIVAYTWGPKWETNIIDFVEHSQIICYSAKWLNGPQVTKGLVDYKGYKPGKLNDTKLLKDIHTLIDEADIIVTQNGVSFDMKTLNARFMARGMNPPSPYKNIDTKIEMKKVARLPSYKLDDMGDYLSIGRKIEHEGFDLWKKCASGDKKAWKMMKDYNAQDVLLTEKLYLKIRPFMKTHPNVAAFSEAENCPKCDSSNAQRRGFQYNNTVKYQRYQCNDCHGWYRGSKGIKLAHKPGTNI